MYRRVLFTTLLVGLAGSAQAISVGSRADNFRLYDHLGGSHELYYFSDLKAVVLMTHQVGCKATQGAVTSLNTIREQYRPRGAEVLMLNSAAGDARDAVRKDLEKASNSVPVLLDPLQLIGESLETTTAGEVLVINPANWTVEYKGGIDGVSAAVDALTNGKPVAKSASPVKGCAVNLPEMKRREAHAKISYEKTIAPILKDNCVTCHREGGIGPWAMSSYDMVRGFSPMVREVLRTQRMPPWHADPHYGVFSNDRSMTADEAKALVHWIEAGAPRGKGEDPLTQLPKLASTWILGEPDLVLEIPPFDVPATGTIPYQRPVIKNPLGRDVWLRAIAHAPTDRAAVHHILAGMTRVQNSTAQGVGPELGSALGTYVPGDVPHFLPPDTGVFIPKEADFTFQMHYTATGKAVKEVTRVGLYFTEKTPKYPMRNVVLADPRLSIPPNTKAHRVATARKFDREIIIYNLTPHSHVRGNGAEFVAEYPDGKKEVLLSVPKYDFNWQTTYELTKPKVLPKGSTLHYSTTYDNSSQNKANPNPNIEVRWGQQTWEEMLYGDVRFRYTDEVATSGTQTPKTDLTARSSN